jgi:MFS family permease
MTLDRNRLVPLIVACALFMENLDSTIIATALPTIARALDEDPLHLSFAITSYLLSLSVFIPLSGWMADRYGTRAVFRNAILIFVVGSIGCAASQSIGQLVAARLLQGLGGAMMVPVGRLVLLGPPLGGLIVTVASWRWIFLINIPIGIVGWLLVSRHIRDLRDTEPAPLDLGGWMLLGSGVAGVVFGFESLGKNVLPALLQWLVLGVGVLLLGLYVRHARQDSAPILNLGLLRIPTFRIAISGGSLFRIGIGSFSLLMPMMLQLGFGLDALQSGLITFASAIGALLLKTIARRITQRHGFRRLLVVNAVISSLALMACALLRPETPYLLVIVFLLTAGFLRSLQFTCINAMAFADVDETQMSQATSFSSTAQQLSLSIGVGIAAQVLNLSLALRQGDTLIVSDFATAFCVIGLISMSSALSFRRLSADAGSNVSGHRLALAGSVAESASEAGK